MPYIPFLQTLYDETGPVGTLGRGTHYSVFRALSWHDAQLVPLSQTSFVDFAVIWDEDHDERVMEVLKKIYFDGLLTPIRFIGERKGGLSVLIAPEIMALWSQETLALYKGRINEMSQNLDDSWPSTVDSLTGTDHGIIADDREKVDVFLRNIHNLWRLGIKPTS